MVEQIEDALELREVADERLVPSEVAEAGHAFG